MGEHQDNGLEDLSPSLRSAVEAIISEPILLSNVRRALAPVHEMHRPIGAKRAITPRRALVVVALAASVFVGVWMLRTTGHSAWAEVVDAVAGHSWLHGSGKLSDGRNVEFWYSAPRQIMASKTGDRLVWQNARQRIMESFGGQGPNPSAIMRSEITSGNRDRLVLFQALLNGNVKEFLDGSGAELVEESHRRVNVDGEVREQFRFVVAEPNSEIRTKTTLLVDPKTKLPIRWESISTGSADGVKYHLSCELSYPDSGPETIYALGAPRSAPIIDNVPRGDLKRILLGLKQGRTRFDTYRGIAVTGSKTQVPDGSGPAICYQVWRKGLKWRIELCQIKGQDRLPDGADPHAWWNAQVAKSPRILRSLSDGTRHCKMKPVYAQPTQPDPDNPRYLKIASFTKDVRAISEPSDPWMFFYAAEMPAIVGHPNLLGEFSTGYETSVNTKPDRGPAGCVLVESLRRGNQQRNLVGKRYWIDPTRNYLAMLTESLSGTPDNHKVRQATEIVGTAQSPSGCWYQTQLRVIGGSVSLETGERSDYFNNYYLDFDADVPDELFQIPE